MNLLILLGPAFAIFLSCAMRTLLVVYLSSGFRRRYGRGKREKICWNQRNGRRFDFFFAKEMRTTTTWTKHAAMTEAVTLQSIGGSLACYIVIFQMQLCDINNDNNNININNSSRLL